jgi:isoquinoline 1-oxidoreductase beta subunit
MVVGHEHRIGAVEMSWRFGFGEALTAGGAEMGGNGMYSQGIINLQVRSPYNFGRTSLALQELQIGIDTVAWRSVWSAMARCAEEIMVDEVAAKLGEDPLAFRLRSVKNDRARAVLQKAADAGQWGRQMAPGTAQGLGFHEEYRSCVAYLVELDARVRRNVRVTKAVVAVDAGHPINPRGLAAQMEGGLGDAIARTLLAGLHIDHGAVRESGLHDYRLTRQFHYPTDVSVFVMPSTTGRPGGAGELGVTAASGAVANAWARATGTKPRRFPLLPPS